MFQSIRSLATIGCVPLLCLALSPRFAEAQDKTDEAVPLKKLVLFNSGVGYFEHSGTVDGDASVELKFNVDDINDLLKSLVTQDLGGGRISTVTYGSRDPITRTLKTFSIDLTTSPTIAELLSQIRGEKVEVESPNKMSGTILGVEKRKRKVDDDVVEYDVLNLVTDTGLRSVSLEQVTSIRLLNEKLDVELRQALLILATGNSTDKKTVTLNFLGQGKRPVRIGYIQETPVWKTSYRLVLDDEAQPQLQGWAIVENQTESDWSNVNLKLVSGRPISFRMDLYQPLYVNRPIVVPELFASLRSRLYDQDLASRDMEFAALAEKGEAKDARKKSKSLANYELARRATGKARAPVGYYADRKNADSDDMDIMASVRSAASTADVGELFQYQIEQPVTLARQKSAMLPIVNAEVKGEKVSIYNPSVHVKHPLNALRFTNSTKLHLMQGPITVFDGGIYAGDARIQNLAPGTTRLISYAMDLDTEVARTTKSSPEQLVSVKIIKGVLYASRKLQRSQNYTVKNSGRRTKTVLIEQRFEAGWKLIAPEKPTEKTRDMYRFAVAAETGEPEKLTVTEERMMTQSVYLTSVDDNTIRIYVSASVVSDEAKKALEEVIRRKQALSVVATQRKQLEQQILVIGKEQDRIRQNMAQLDRNTELYSRYVKKFGEQEDKIESMRAEILKLQGEETKLKKSLDEYLIGLNIT